MGLDITAVSYLGERVGGLDEDLGERVCGLDEDHDHEEDRLVRVWSNEDFPGRADPLKDGYYRTTDQSREIAFRAGSYSGYGNWRAALGRLVGFSDLETQVWILKPTGDPKAEEIPFYELLHFSDCEGTIGPVVSRKLADEFDEHEAAAAAHMDQWDLELYREWKRAFRLAASAGVVRFH